MMVAEKGRTRNREKGGEKRARETKEGRIKRGKRDGEREGKGKTKPRERVFVTIHKK